MCGLADGVIQQLPSQTFTLPPRVNGNVVNEVRVNFRPGNHIAVDRAASLNHEDMVGGDLRSKIGQHRGRLAAYAFGLTRSWRPEWGGLLLFHDRKGDVSGGFTPRKKNMSATS